MADSTHPLSAPEREQLLRYLVQEEGSNEFYRIRNARIVRIFLVTGMHPLILASPRRWSLRTEKTPTGGTRLLWDRTKTKAWVAPVLPDSVAIWIDEFLKTMPEEMHPIYINQLVKRAGRQAGISGVVTPRTLRHTFLRWVADKTHDISEVQRLGAVSMKVALNYIRTAEGRYDETFRNG